MQVLFCTQFKICSIKNLISIYIQSRLKSLKQDYKIFAYIWIFYDWFKNSLFLLCGNLLLDSLID